MSKTLFLDFETKSLRDLTVVGGPNYSRHPSTAPLMLGHALDDEPADLWLPHVEPKIPAGLMKQLKNPKIVKASWNVPFERSIFLRTLGIDIPLSEWLDIMVLARWLSLPGKLEEAGPLFGIPQDQLKITDGKRLIKLFCEPYSLGGRETLFGIEPPMFHDHESRPADWKLFEEYCKRDVEVERDIYKIAREICPWNLIKNQWQLDQKINEAGIPTNRTFATNALSIAVKSKTILTNKLKEITKLENPNSRDQILGWLKPRGYEPETMGKAFVTMSINDTGSPLTDEAREVLKIRQEASKTSFTKYETLLELLGDDDRLCEQFVFLGASRTGRWSGRGLQFQNLPRPEKAVEKKIKALMQMIMDNDYAAVEKEFPSVINAVTSAIRSTFQAPPGKKLVVCDLSAIENRVLGWVAGCDAIARVFREGRDAYLDFATYMYHVAYESLILIDEHGVHKAKDAQVSEWRQVAKPAVLGCGYGLGSGVELRIDPQTGAKSYEPVMVLVKGNWVKTGLLGYAENMGVKLTPEQAYKAHAAFRAAYPEVVKLWYNLERAAKAVLAGGFFKCTNENCRKPQTYFIAEFGCSSCKAKSPDSYKPVKSVTVGFCKFEKLEFAGRPMLRITLPSGRGLHYVNAIVKIEEKTVKGKTRKQEVLYYDGFGHGVGKIAGGWGPVYTYGGKITENIVQAISRDLLVEGMLLADDLGAEIVGHVHDEIIVLADDDPFGFGLCDLRQCMMTTPEWAPGLILGAEGYEAQIYRKG